MKVLVFGDEHTYGYGLTSGNLSYIGHFVRQVKRTGQPVSVEVYAHLTIAQVSTTLARLPLRQYDLIILQFDQRSIHTTQANFPGSASRPLPVLPYSLKLAKQEKAAAPGMRGHLSALRMLLRSMIRPARQLPLSLLLEQLRPYRHNVLVLTPLPHRERVNKWLHKRSRSLLLQRASEQLFGVFDTDAVIQPRDEYFLTADSSHLNASSHELLGRSLFDFYLSAPTIITIQAIRRE